jgi:hypothetical protein
MALFAALLLFAPVGVHSSPTRTTAIPPPLSASPARTTSATAAQSPTKSDVPRDWPTVFGSAGVAAVVMLVMGGIAVYITTQKSHAEYKEVPGFQSFNSVG